LYKKAIKDVIRGSFDNMPNYVIKNEVIEERLSKKKKFLGLKSLSNKDESYG